MDETLAHQVQVFRSLVKTFDIQQEIRGILPMICSQTWEFVTFSSEIISKTSEKI